MNCPICDSPMILMHGCGWDYDRWMCAERTEGFRVCEGEVELEETTYPEGME